MSRKITLIGAGSVVFAKTLIGDILRFPELADSHICLMDIDPDRLRVAEIMMRKIAAKLGVPATISATLDRREAVRGAKYVICTIQVGGYKPSTVRDFEIPKKYGLRQTIADTLGVGGVFRGLRTIPVLVELAREIAELGHPDCLFLNYTNPMAMNCWAVDRAVGIPHVGLCHSVFGTAYILARHAGLPMEDVSYLVAGVNHMAFFLKFQYRGQDAYPLLFKVLEDPARNFEKVRYEMMRRTGYFVTESSEHQSEYVPYFIHHGEKVIADFDIPLDEYIRRCESINATWTDTERSLLGEDKDIVLNAQSHEYGSYIIHSIETNTLRTVYGNVPNRHIIDNLTLGCNVEVPCQVDATGLNPVRIGELPPQLAALCQSQIAVQQLTVEAALTRKREHIYHAVMADPHTAATLTLDQIWAMCDELIAAHQEDGFLGDFAPTLPNTGRSFAGTGDRILARIETGPVLREEAGASNPLRIVVENPSREAATVELALELPAGAFVEAAPTFSISVGAGETETHEFTLTNANAIADGLRLNLDSPNRNVFRRGILIQPRRRLSLARGQVLELALTLYSFPAGTLRLEAVDGGIAVDAHVLDSNPVVNPKAPWAASCVELFFSPPDASGIRQIVVVPEDDSGAPLVMRPDNQPIAAREASFTRNQAEYRWRAVFSWEDLGLNAADPGFLFDAIWRLSALGDAHSGGTGSLSGKNQAHESTAAYAWVARTA